jgi:mannosylglycoprotein endo-beta-mannosidase
MFGKKQYHHPPCGDFLLWIIISFVSFYFQTSLVESIVSERSTEPTTIIEDLHHGWTACRVTAVVNPALGCREDNHRPSNENTVVLLNVTKLPTTALAVLLDNQQITEAQNVTMENLYYSQNLASIPDISVTGQDYYTLLYQIEIPPTLNHRCDSLSAKMDDIRCRSGNRRTTTLHFAGINYRATVWFNGEPLKNLYNFVDATTLQYSAPHQQYPGMFIRHRYDISEVTLSNSSDNVLVVLIEPPDHPGYPIAGQQGGSHDLAKDGAIPQYMLGWDWCYHMPDRATGFYGSVTLQSSFGGLYTIHDPAVQTLSIHNCSWSSRSLICSAVSLRILAHIEGPKQRAEHHWTPSNNISKSITLQIISDWGEEWMLHYDDLGEQTSSGVIADIQVDIIVEQPERIQLWWPHGVGIDDYAHMHLFSFSLFVDDVISDIVTFPVGIRMIETFVDNNLQGQRFNINGHKVYLVGGNWIGTDQALRYSASEQRYCDEILLHQHAGLNLIRVWGGGTAERDQFYDCADRYGVFVYQEFWMTGDNNGRWAGDYSWPLNYDVYLVNVEDTVKRLRRHPSLLFYGGCNECLSPRESKWAPNPPRKIDDGTRRLIEKFDPGRLYISSSMGGVRMYIWS